ncbi:c-type cytochrome [Glaciecola sp. MH2013]|nr:c-type cytochrome [Glaciecola sp. MH2013]
MACSEGQQVDSAPEQSTDALLPGGDLTANRLSDHSYVEVSKKLSAMQRLDFWTGFSLFRDPWVIAPSSTADRDGLGPLFNTRSCISCHSGGARGPATLEGISKPSSLVLRLGQVWEASEQPNQLAEDESKRAMMMTKAFESSSTFARYGGQIQPRAIQIQHPSMSKPLVGEAKLDLRYTTLKGTYADGSEYELRQPNYRLHDLAFGSLSEGTDLSPRFAPPIFGSGLLDAISEDDLIAQADPNDIDGDGISGKYNQVPLIRHQASNQQSDELRIGRFGWKAKHPTLMQQVAAAFVDDIGITNNYFPDETCSTNEKDCQIAALLGLPKATKASRKPVEIPDKLLNLVLKVNLFMAVPPARDLSSPSAISGRKLFYQAKCHSCHTPSYTTSEDYPIEALAKQKIWPYTDLALHDMGPALADNVVEYSATGQEWKTPPLWGIGLRKAYQSDAVYLHDGRAQTIEEAILWHGGEAQASKEFFKQLDAASRADLLTFLNAI